MSVMCQGCSAELATWTGKCPSCGSTQQIEMKKRADPLIGKIISGKYKITKKLGQGGMGAVYLAEHTSVGQRVAVKFLNQAFSGDPDIVRRFLNEAKSYGQITHPNAVHLHDFGQDEDGNLFISMEYIEGDDLKKTLEKGGKLKLRDAVDVVMQIAEVLGHAHQKGIVHRDMKPENVMMIKGLRGYHAKVLDFGVARLMEEQGTRLTAVGSICGTPRYMSPEQAQGGDVDHRTDIYALGLVLFESVTGRHPFPGTSIAEILRKQVMEPTPHLYDFAPDLKVPDGLDTVIQQATAKNVNERFSTMHDFAAAVADAMPTDSSMDAYDIHTDPGLQDASTMMKGKAVEKTAHKASPYDRNKKGGEGGSRTPLFAGIGAAAVLLLGGGAFLAMSGSKSADAAPQKVAVKEPEIAPALARVAPTPAPTPSPAPTPDPVGTGTPHTVENSNGGNEAVTLLAHNTLFNQAQNEWVAGRLETCAQMLTSIPLESPVAHQVTELRAKIAEVRGLMERGSSSYARGNCGDAIKFYSEVLKKNPGMQGAQGGISKCKNQMPTGTIE